MLNVLVPVDALDATRCAPIRHAIAEYRRHHELELHLLNVQPRLSRHAARFVSRARTARAGSTTAPTSRWRRPSRS